MDPKRDITFQEDSVKNKDIRSYMVTLDYSGYIMGKAPKAEPKVESIQTTLDMYGKLKK